MKEINCLIVDDEPIARSILEAYVMRLPKLTLLRSCRNAAEAYEVLYEHRVDVILLDIKMPVITGIEFFRSLPNPPLVIFTTAYSGYAVQGFELNSVDYLMKPITFERFNQAIQRVHERLTTQKEQQMIEAPSYIFLKQDTRLVKVNFDEINYIQAERDFCAVYLNNGKRLLAGMHLKILENRLPVKKFMRVHRSYIINLDKITGIKGNVIEFGSHEIPIGTSYREVFLKALRLS